jgi:3-keto-disaccharide hydrolase
MRTTTLSCTFLTAYLLLLPLLCPTPAAAALNQPPEGFVALFNGKDLSGWKGLLKGPYDNPAKRATLTAEEYQKRQKEADEDMRAHWEVVDGVLHFDGKGRSLCTAKDYGDFEMLVDWKIKAKGDSGIYLRGAPQVQIWDPANFKLGSGGLYNNKNNPSKPDKNADKPIGQWNTFRIIMIGEKVTIFLNDVLVVDNVTLENYWERDKPIYPTGQIELQNHGNDLYFRNVYIREILSPHERIEGFVPLFNGRDMTGWTGNTKGYYAQDGVMLCDPTKAGGNVYTADQYDNFVLRFEFKLPPGANNGLAIRAPLGGDAAYKGMELQILDNTADKYAKLQPYQYHGSIYGVVPAKRGHLRPVGQWNYEEVIAKGPHITVNLNGATIVDADIEKASTPETMDHRDHPGLKRKTGHIGFCGHGDRLEFRNIRVKVLK